MLRDFSPRRYQETIFATAVNHNTLVVLPTGMGKTSVALMLAAHRLRQYPGSKVLILAPTKPLVEQIMQVFRQKLDIPDEEIVMFTGNMRPETRHKEFLSAKVIISTPQGLQNDIIGGKIDLSNVSLLVFDESHRAVGDYAYVFIAEQYHKKARYEKILALTASPGSEMEKIEEVMQNLFIEKIELRTDSDHDVKPYIQEMDIKWVMVELTEEFRAVRKYIEDCYNSKISELKETGILNPEQARNLGKVELLKLQGFLHSEISRGNKDFESLKAVSKIAEALKIQHALELVETQGVQALYLYLEKLNQESHTTKVKAVQNLVKDINFRSALIKSRSMFEDKVEHPKMGKLLEILMDELKGFPEGGKKIIVFNQYRDSAQKIVEEVNKFAKAKLFVGQQKKNGHGMSQKEQIATISDFREGNFDVLVSTAVGEEGLDIPQVDLVIFYEPVPSAIRTIQRRGRTGRTQKGRMMVLVAKGTRDEGYRWSAHHKEQRMYRNLDSLKSKHIESRKKDEIALETKALKGQMGLLNFHVSDNHAIGNVKIFADDREKASGVIKELVNMDCELVLQRLDVADYVLSYRVGVEFKTVPDFVDSIIDGRLLSQLKEIKEFYQRPLIIVEGQEDIYSLRKIHPNAINGMLATITVSYGIPILYTRNPKETAMLLTTIAIREQTESGKDFHPHSGKRNSSLKEQQEYVVSSFPGIGGTLSKPLLERFGSVKNIINASLDELKKVDMIGKVKAEKLKEVFEKEYGREVK